MSEVDRLMDLATGPAKPAVQFDSYSVWADSQPDDADVSAFHTGYADYLREEHIKANAYDSAVEQDILKGMYGSLVKDGRLQEGDLEGFEKLNAAPEMDFDRRADFFLSSVEFDKDENSDYRKVQRYVNHRDQIARGELKIMGEVPEDQTNLLEQRRLEAEDVMSRHGDDDLRRLAVKNGELAFASVLNDKGQRVVIAGDRALETDLLTGLKQSKTGGVTLADALGAKAELEIPEGFSLPRFQLRRVHEAATGLEELVKQDAFLQTQVAGHAQKMAKMEYDDGDKLSWGMDQFGQGLTDIFGRLLGIAGTEERKIEREAQQRAEQTDVRQVVRSLVKRLNASGESDFTQEEVMKAYTQVVLNDATANGRFEFHDGDDEVGKNIRTFGYGAPSVHPAAMANEDTFNKMLAARPDISDSVKDNLRANRKAYLTDSFDDTSNLLGRSGVADDWHEALIEGRRQGKKNYEILNDFLADKKNFSAFSERAKGVAWSLWDAGAQLVAAVPAAMGADWAQDTLVASAQRNSDRRQVAQLFGEDFGFGQDIAETIAPMLTDVAATAALAAVTAKAGGVGAVAYQAGKQGARLTAKGIVKGLTTSAFRNVGEKGAKDAAESLVTQGLIKESIKDTSGKGSMAAIKAYNGLLAKKIAKHSKLPAVFVPAATRSGGATYGSVYNTLSQDPSLSEEEIHDRALGAALGAGALTGLITATFSAFGRGGVEDALLRGLNYKQAKALIGSLSNTSGISDATFKKVVADQMKATLKKFEFATARGLIGDAKDEAIEEGLDQLFNGFIEDAALHQNTPMVERFQQSMYAAALGGTMGAGATGIRKIAGSIAPNTYEKAAQARQLQDQFVADVTARLENTDSPMTARAVAALLTSKARKRGERAAAPQEPDVAPDQAEEQLELGLDVEPTADAAPTTPTGQPSPTLAAVDARLAAIEQELGPRTRLVGDSSNPDTMVSQDIRIPTVEESQLLELRKEIADREAPSLPTKEVEDAIAERMLRIATLMIEPASGRKNKKRSRRQQRQIQRLEDEIAFMQENNTTDIPAEIPKRAPVEQPTPPAPTQEQLELDLNTEEAATPKQIIERLDALPAEDARARVLLAIDDMEGPRLFDRRIAMSILSTSKTGRTAPFNSLFPPNVAGAAEAAGADPQQAALNNAKHVDFFLPDQEEDLDPAPKRIGYVFPKDPERRKSFAVGKKVEFDLKPFKEGDTAQEEELAEALSAVQLAQQGYPVRFGSGIKYGTIVDNKRMKSKSDFVANAVYTYYPTIEADASQISETRASTRQRTYFDPAQNKTVTGRIKMPLDADGRGIFTNDPVVVAEMLAHNIPVRVPYGTKNINPAIKPYIKRGYVTDVRMTSKDGSMLESAITRVDAPTDLRPNNNMFENIAKVQFRGLPPVENELNELLMAHSELGAERNMPDKIGQLFSSKNFKMDSEFADYTVQSTATEFALTSHLYELHKYFMDSRRRRTLVDSPKGKTINPSSRKRAIAELRSRLSGDPELSEMAEILSPMLRLKESAKPTHTEVVIQFIEDFVLNNPDFDGGVMPTFDSIFERTFNRYAQQQRERGINERNKALVSIDTEEAGTNVIDTQQLRNGTLDVGGIDPAEQIDEGAFLNTVTNVIDTAIDSVDTDPMLRDALNDLALQSIYTNPDSGTVSHVQRMNTRDLMARIGTWMSAGDHATRPAALEFTALLESGDFRSGIELRNALRLTSLFGRIDGDASANPDVISEVRRQLSESLGQPVTEARARNFVRSMDGAMRRRLSRAVIGKISDVDALEQNTIEAERLGLKSGDPSSVIAALEQISKRSKNKSHRLVAELLLEDKIFIQKVGFSMGQSDANIAGEYVRHTDGKHSVFLNMQKSNGIDLENVLLEEYVHAFMSDTLAKPDELLNSRQQTARRRLEGLYQIAQREYRRVADSNSADTNAVLEAGLENMDEFVANFLLDPDFQKFIKTLDTPVGQRGFFARILDAMVAMFRKISPKENALYAAALKDVVDLSKSTMRSSAVPFKQQAASAVHEASNRIQEAGRVMTLRTSVMPAPETETETEVATEVATDEGLVVIETPEAGSTQLISDSQKDLTTEQQQAEFEEVVGFLRERLPYGVQFKHDPNMPAAMGADGDFILINPKILMRGLESFDRLGKRKMVDIMLHEEIGHEASFGALTQAEIDGLVDSLSDEQYAEIASEYYRFNPDQQQQALANLQSEDPAVVAEEKFRLAEEKLRMRLQEITRGYTTEEDAEFWRSKPSLMAILKRYIGGVINKWAANRRLNGASGTMDAALTKVIGEMQAIELGFSRQKLSQTFNPNLPAESVEAYMRALNADPLGDIEDYTNAANQVALFAATAIDAKAFNRIMNYAGLDMELARRTKKRGIDVESMTDEERDAFLEEEQRALEMELAGAPIDLDDLDPDLDQFMATDDEIFGVDSELDFDSDSDLDSDVVVGDKIKEVFEAVNVGADYALEVKTDQGRVDITLKGNEGQEINSVDLYVLDNGVIKIGEMKSAKEIGRARMGSSFAETLLTTLIVNNQELGIRRITTTAGGSSRDARTSRAYKEVINRFVAPNVNQEDSPSVKMSGMESLAPRNLSMNGYYSWPAYGFDIIPTPLEFNAEEIFGDEYFQKNVKSSIRDAVLEVDENLEQYGSTVKDVSGLTNEEIVQSLLKKAKAELEELRSLVTRPDGQIDFFYGMHDENIPRATRNRVAYLWQMYGVQAEVEMSLSRYSANLAAFLQRKFSSLVAIKQIPELTAIVDEFETNRRKLKKETDSESLPEAYQDLQDEYNARVINEGLLDFPVFTSIGQNAGDSSSLDGVDFGNVVQLLEMPMYEYQAYKAPKGWLSRLFMGDVGRPVKQLIDQREAFKRASTRLVKQYKEKMDKLIVEAYGDPSNTDWDLIAQAQGYVDGGLLNEDTIQQLDDEHMARLDRINQNDQLTPREKQIMRDSSRAKRDKSIENAEELALKQAQRASDAALTKLGQRSSELAAHIKSMRRDLIQPIQQKMKDAGLTDEISAKIDRTGGIYITRAYRMFNDPTFAERVRTDPQYADLRDRAMKFFEDELYKNMYNSTYSQTYDKLVDQGMDAGLAKAKAEEKATKKAKKAVKKAYDKAGHGHTAGSAALEAFLDKYSERTGVSPQSANGLKVLENNLKKRKDVPKVIRELLGEYGPQEGTDLIVRTFSTVANVAAQQTFLNNVAEVGKQQGFLVDQATYEAARDQYEDYVPLRKGNSTNPNDPLNNLYGPRDMVEAMQDTLNPSFTVDHNSTSEKAVRGLTAVAQKLTGQAMAMKTLGSVGFFLRNALGNFLFFGPAQGFFRVDKMMGRSLMFNRTSLDEKGQRLTDAQVQEYLTELTGLNIVGDELHAGLLRQLLNGEIDPDSALAKINKAIDEIPVIGKTKKGAAALQKKLADLSAAIDGRYKIAYYENELSMLLEAKRRYPKSDIGRMSEYDLKRMAAEKVLMTAQSLSQAPPLAQALTKSGFGMVFAPFIRFKMEVPRIVINTYKLAARERKSDNPMVRARGTRRFFAMTGVLGGFSAAVPATLAALSGVGEEEDEALRKSMPEYLRGHTFFYLRDDKGNLRSVNMTYLNPFSLLVDPFLRSLPKLAKGDISDAVGQFTKGMVFDTYLDDQILAGSMMDVLKNRNSTTDDPIWVEGVDGLGASLLKSATYLYENSYQPRLLKDMIDAKNATGGDYEGFSNSPLGQLLDGAYPVKVHEVDLQKQYRRFIYSHLDRMSAVNKQKYELYSKESFDPDKIDSIYQRELDGKRALNQEMLRVARGFEGLGLSARDQFGMLKSRGVGKDRARLMFHGIMDRPDINKQFAKGLIERGYAARLNELLKARDKRARYLHIEDPD